MKIYTKTGDDGSTGLFGGKRVSKTARRVAAYGDVDELNSVLGLARSFSPPAEVDDELHLLQEQLFELGADLATPAESKSLIPRLENEDVERVERAIDRLEAELPPLESFILPSGSSLGSSLHLARTVCRRAERSILELVEAEGAQAVSDVVLRYVNRVSDFLFVLARYANHVSDVTETPWKPGRLRGKASTSSTKE